ncbi:MAG: helix-turn-helix domain-containing protein [Candidatus Margulisbacteria bacterium]|jgi:transcriptional regulator with XRE-family HTH domain|nr:helix-turn-helix domain-containing protein [Candidatus Margulisiibacteriota bacterium]
MSEQRDFLQILGRRIRTMREARGISLNKFAYENDFTKSGLSKIETGQSDLRATTLKKISSGLDITLSELIKDL